MTKYPIYIPYYTYFYINCTILYKNKESLCDSLRARVGTQVHLQLHTGRIPAEHFCFIGKEISYKAKKTTPLRLSAKQNGLFYVIVFPRKQPLTCS